jgi:hypothetical protein
MKSLVLIDSPEPRFSRWQSHTRKGEDRKTSSEQVGASTYKGRDTGKSIVAELYRLDEGLAGGGGGGEGPRGRF